MRDDQNHETTVGYDNLGRRTQLNNLDTGLTETVYDLASNVVQRITANLRAQGKAIKHEYDYKRLTRITYPNFPGNNVSYTYGGPDAPFNRAGRIITVADQSGQEERFYGPLGEVVKSIKTIASDTGKQPEVYTTEYEYDTWNRLQKLIYPDGEVLTNQYDSGGLLQSASQVGWATGLSLPTTLNGGQTFLSPGHPKAHFGYRLPAGTLVVNAQPIEITID